MKPYPLTFDPIYKAKPWGGRRLEALFDRSLPPGQPIGESWELVDFPREQSIVNQGPAAGTTIHDLLTDWGPDLTGTAPLNEGRFPLLLKFLDAREPLSIQIHPDAAAAREIGGSTRSKDEAWYVVEARDDAWLYRGVNPGATRDELEAAAAAGTLTSWLQRVSARPGHAIHLPGGTIHALGDGVVVAEVQTPSDTTYRLYDWDRIDPATGNPRTLHLREGLRCARIDRPPEPTERPRHVASVWTAVSTLIRTPAFAVDRVRMVAGLDQPVPGGGTLVWMLLEGRCSIHCAGYATPFEFRRGQTVLLPAGIIEARVQTPEPSMWLEVSIPAPGSMQGSRRLDPQELQALFPPERIIPLRLPGSASDGNPDKVG